MRRAGIVALVISMAVIGAGCAATEWVQKRTQCGLKCPKDSSCQIVQSGVFTAQYGCMCKYWQTEGGPLYPYSSGNGKDDGQVCRQLGGTLILEENK